jgi:uncharacterized protein
MIKNLPLLALLLISPVMAAGEPQSTADSWQERIDAEGVIELDWDDLVPPDYFPDKLFTKIAEKYKLTELDDNDPRAQKIQDEVRELWNHAPVVDSLNGRRVRLPGLVVPLEGDAEKVREFLLVPYYGACIHVPPPPSNQIVFVRSASEATGLHEMFEAVWVTGTLQTEHSHNELGDASYTLMADKIVPYEE